MRQPQLSECFLGMLAAGRGGVAEPRPGCRGILTSSNRWRPLTDGKLSVTLAMTPEQLAAENEKVRPTAPRRPTCRPGGSAVPPSQILWPQLLVVLCAAHNGPGSHHFAFGDAVPTVFLPS